MVIASILLYEFGNMKCLKLSWTLLSQDTKKAHHAMSLWQLLTAQERRFLAYWNIGTPSLPPPPSCSLRHGCLCLHVLYGVGVASGWFCCKQIDVLRRDLRWGNKNNCRDPETPPHSNWSPAWSWCTDIAEIRKKKELSKKDSRSKAVRILKISRHMTDLTFEQSEASR